MMINIFDTTLGTWRALSNAHHVNEPSWSHDPRFIYYDTGGEEPAALRRVRIEDGMVEELTTLAGLPLAYHWSGLSPDDESLLLSNAGSSRMYALMWGHATRVQKDDSHLPGVSAEPPARRPRRPPLGCPASSQQSFHSSDGGEWLPRPRAGRFGGGEL